MAFRRAFARTDRFFPGAHRTLRSPICSTLNCHFSDTSSLDLLRNPPPSGKFILRNSYVPLNRRTLVRELLHDSSVIRPDERERFEQFALFLDQKIHSQFLLLKDELSLLFQTVNRRNDSSELPAPSESASAEPSTVLTSSEVLDREFWLLRRLSQLAPRAGFIELTRDQIENVCRPKRLDRSGATLFVDPNDYDVIRFWVRGIHPRGVKVISDSKRSITADKKFGFLRHLGNSSARFITSTQQFFLRLKSLRTTSLSSFIRSPMETSLEPKVSPNDPYFSSVLMVNKRKKDQHLQLKLFEDVPASKPSGHSAYVGNLAYLLPEVRFRALTHTARAMIAVSSVTAFGCLFIVTPLAWLLTSNPDLVVAWSVAATAGAGATASLVWSRYWRAQARFGHWLKMLQYQCGQTSGQQALNSILKVAHEEEFKAALLTYALLRSSSEAGTAVNSVQLGIRAESWIAKRLSPKSHVSLPSVFSKPQVLSSVFTGGSGPLFDLVFDVERPLETLRRLDLIRGSSDYPTSRSLDEALNALHDKHERGGGNDLSALWLVDPLVDNNRIDSPVN